MRSPFVSTSRSIVSIQLIHSLMIHSLMKECAKWSDGGSYFEFSLELEIWAAVSHFRILSRHPSMREGATAIFAGKTSVSSIDLEKHIRDLRMFVSLALNSSPPRSFLLLGVLKRIAQEWLASHFSLCRHCAWVVPRNVSLLSNLLILFCLESQWASLNCYSTRAILLLY